MNSVSKKKSFPEIVLSVLLWIGKAIVFLAKQFVRYLFAIVITLILVGIITGGIVAIVFATYIRDNVDASFDINSYVSTLNQTSKIYYTDYVDNDRTVGVDKEYGDIHSSVNRVWATVNSNDDDDLIIPEHLINAYVAVEDKRFFQHSGVDWIRTGSAVLNMATTFSKSYGGSTITQQLIKNLTGDDETTIQRKIQEILRALYLERTLTDEYSDYENPKYRAKQKIIETYLNTIFLSQGAYGVQAASQTYFSKNVSELTLVEAAALAAIPQNPYKWNPASFPENNKKRRNEVLSRMYAQHMISEEEYREAINTELVLNMNSSENSLNSYFIDYMIDEVKDDLMEKYGYTDKVAEQMVYGGGLQIYSTIDPKIQQIMEEEYNNDENFPKLSEGIQPQSAMVVIDPYTGRLLGMVGGRGTKNGSVLNRAANSKRQPGSTIKPLSTYSLGIENKLVTWSSVLDDAPVQFNIESKSVWPHNSSNTYRGLTTLKYGLQQSLNTIAVRIMKIVTPESSYDFLTSQLGITTLVASETTSSGTVLSDIGLAPMALGAVTYGVKLVEIANAYCMFPNDGIYSESSCYTKVLDKDGNVLLSNEIPDQYEVILPQTATIMNLLLMNVVQNGTGSAAKLKNKIQVAGKTGTTDDKKDLWFMGYTPYLMGGCWFGYDTPKRISGYTTNPALSIWNTVMTRIHDELIFPKIENGEDILKTFKTVEQTGNIVKCEYCIDSGMLPCESSEHDLRGDRIETGYFIKGTEPTKLCDVHIDIKYDSVTKSVACEGCPDANIKTVSLIKVDREFPFYVAIGDAQYTYRDVGKGFTYTADEKKPFYFGLRTFKYKDSNGNEITWPYYGIASSVTHSANTICKAHLNSSSAEQNVETPPELPDVEAGEDE